MSGSCRRDTTNSGICCAASDDALDRLFLALGRACAFFFSCWRTSRS